MRVFPYQRMSGSFVRQFVSIYCLTSHAVPVEVLSLQREVHSSGNPQCFLSGSDITLTCNVVGFPRPTIVFSNNLGDIMPGQAGFERIANISFDQVYMGMFQASQLEVTCSYTYMMQVCTYILLKVLFCYRSGVTFAV